MGREEGGREGREHADVNRRMKKTKQSSWSAPEEGELLVRDVSGEELLLILIHTLMLNIWRKFNAVINEKKHHQEET